MKGEEITIKGQALADTVTRIDLFDGLFTTGYRLTGIDIAPKTPRNTETINARLLTADLPHTDEWDWNNNFEVGWACWFRNSTSGLVYGRVDEDMSIVEDLFIDIGGSAGDFINYKITMRKVTFPIGIGAMNMVRNQSQGPVP